MPVHPELEEVFYESEIGRLIYTFVVEYCIMNDRSTYNTMINYYTENRTIDLYDDEYLYEALNDNIFMVLDFIEQSYFCHYGSHIFLYEICNPSDLIAMLFFFVFQDYQNDLELELN
jgi:hypothetical protein